MKRYFIVMLFNDGSQQSLYLETDIDFQRLPFREQRILLRLWETENRTIEQVVIGDPNVTYYQWAPYNYISQIDSPEKCVYNSGEGIVCNSPHNREVVCTLDEGGGICPYLLGVRNV